MSGRYRGCRPQGGAPGGKAHWWAGADLHVGLAGSEGSGRNPGGRPAGSWTLMAGARTDVGIWTHGALWPRAQLAAAGRDVTCQVEAEPRPGPKAQLAQMLTSPASKWWRGLCVWMCVFNSGMNLILISPTLGMGNSCLNELNSGFKIASICSSLSQHPQRPL